MGINIWPDLEEFDPEVREALNQYYSMSFTEQTAMAWVIREHERRVRAAMDSLREQMIAEYGA